tara:strand:+ start:1298 stop:2818 length:1521 start_codon:yes stop_codon:yes gene_type:complete
MQFLTSIKTGLIKTGLIKTGFVANMRAAAIMSGAAGLLVACGPNATLLSEADEARIGAQEHARILKTYGGAYSDQRVTDYVEEVMQKIAQASDKPEQNYQITVLDSPVVNAFALPGGYTYVTRGLLALANSEAELAGVIGHEIGHVTARHGARRHTTAVGASILGTVIGNVLTNSTGINPNVAGDLINFGGSALLAGYSRSQEYEADDIGVRTLGKAGYPPEAQADFLAALGEYSAYRRNGRAAPPVWLATHPSTTERVARAREEADEFVAKEFVNGTAPSGTLQSGRNRYLAIIDGLPYGENIKQGLIRGQRFVHPDLRLAFSVPKKFTLTNAPDRVTATHSNGMELLFDMAGRKEAQRPAEYIRDDWTPRGVRVDVTPIKVAGRPAALGSLRQGGKYIELLAVEYSLTQLMRFVLIAPDNLSGNAQSAMQSVRRGVELLTEKQAAAIKPQRLRVVTVQAGDTLDTLSRYMTTGDDRRQDLFLALNNLKKPANLMPGMRLKLVVD